MSTRRRPLLGTVVVGGLSAASNRYLVEHDPQDLGARPTERLAALTDRATSPTASLDHEDGAVEE